MFSGKTTELLKRISARPPKAVAVFKHRRDDRYSPDEVVAHGRESVPAVTVAGAAEIPPLLTDGISLVAIDEGHFFDEGLPDVCAALARRGIDVAVTSLDLNSWGKPFPVIERLEQVADGCLVKTADCGRCGGVATRTQRLTPIVDGNIVGGPESFEPRCRDCWSPPPEESVD
jgi:thymidine kinase